MLARKAPISAATSASSRRATRRRRSSRMRSVASTPTSAVMQTRLELLEDRAVDLAPLEQLGQIGGEPGVAAVQAPAQAPEEAGTLLAGGFLGSSSEHRPGIVAAKPGGRPSAALARAGLQAL